MREKYIEEEFGRYFIFGEWPNGDVDLVTSAGDETMATVSREDADRLISDRNRLLSVLAKTATRFSQVAPTEFREFWYWMVKE